MTLESPLECEQIFFNALEKYGVESKILKKANTYLRDKKIYPIKLLVIIITDQSKQIISDYY